MRGIAVILLLLAGCGGMVHQRAPVVLAGDCRTAPGAAELRWVLPEDHRAGLDPWCAAVGPAAVVSLAAEPHGVLDSLLVVSWNVHVGGGDLVRLVEDLRSGALTGQPVTHFALLLQEAFRAGPSVPEPPPGSVSAPRIGEASRTRVSVDAVAHALGLHLVYVPSMGNGHALGAREDRGNAILSTLPLEQGVALELPLERQRRVAVGGTVQARTGAGAAWSVQLTSVHLENRLALHSGIAGMSGADARVRQMEWLLRSLPVTDAPAVLAGDLNTWTRGEDEHAARLARRRFRQTDALPDGATHISHVVMRERLDYIFAHVPGGRMSGYERAKESYGSDHYPLLAWIHPPAADLSVR